MAKSDVQIENAGEFDGIIIKNAATEETLKRLVDIMEAKQKGLGSTVLGIANKVINENIAAQKGSTSAAISFANTLDSASSSGKNLISVFSNIIGLGIGTTFSLISSAGENLLDFLKNGYTAFQETATVGATFNNNLLEMRQVAAESAITLEDFRSLIMKNHDAMAFLGGTITQNAKTFASMSKTFRDEFGNELLATGYSLRDLNEGIMGYLEIQGRLGKLNQKSNKEIAEGTNAYLLELDKVTKLTGMQRQAAEDAARKAAVDPIIQSMLDNATDINKAMGNIALITQVGGEDTLQMFKEMAARNPGEEAKMLMATIGMSMEEARDMFTGDIGVEGVIEKMKAYAKKMEAEGLRTGETAEAIMARNPGLAKINKILNAFDKLGDPSLIAKEQKARDQITEAFGVVAKAFNDLYNKFIEKIMASPIFKEIIDRLKQFATVINNSSDDILKAFDGILSTFNTSLTHFMENVNKDGIISAVIKFFGEVFKGLKDNIMPVVAKIFTKMSEDPKLTAQREALKTMTPEQRKEAIAKDPRLAEEVKTPKPGEIPEIPNIFGPLTDGIQTLIGFIPSLSTFASYFGIAGGGAFVAGLGLSAGITAVGTAITTVLVSALTALTPALTALTPAVPVLLSLSAGLAGLGYAFNGISNIIESFANSFAKVKEFLVGVQDLDKEKLKGVGEAISPIATQLAEIGKGAIYNLIGSGGLESLVTSLTKLGEVDPKKVSDIGPSLISLHLGLKEFTSGGIFENLSASLSGFFGSGGLDTVIESLKKLGNVDLSSIGNLSSITSLFTSLKEMSLSNISDSFKETINSITQNLTTGLEQFSKITVPEGILTTLSGFFNSISSLSSVNVSESLHQSLTSLQENLKNISSINFNENLHQSLTSLQENLKSISSINFDNSLYQSLTSLQENLKSISFDNIGNNLSSSLITIQDSVKNFKLDTTSLDMMKDYFRTFNLDTANFENVVGAITNVNTSFDTMFKNQTEGVDKFTKSINTLITSLESLETQLKEIPTLTSSTVGVNTTTNVNDRTPINIAGISPEEYQRQLNIKVDELITHIVEMKQNTKDTADSLSGKRSAI